MSFEGYPTQHGVSRSMTADIFSIDGDAKRPNSTGGQMSFLLLGLDSFGA